MRAAVVRATQKPDQITKTGAHDAVPVGKGPEMMQEPRSALSVLEKAALLSGANTWQTRAIDRIGLPALWLADGPHGVRKQVGSADHLGIHGSEPATCFPTAAAVANSWDERLAEQIGAALGAEAASLRVDVLLGPGLNIKRSPLGGRNFEYFSEDPELSGRLAAAYVRGIQSQGVAATPKHFAANSQELQRMVSDSIVDERTLREIYLTAFEIVVREARPWAIMSSYNLINGEYAHENAHLLMDVLRDEWGFDGPVISDWGGGNDAVAAVRAGGTLEMPSPGFDSAREIVRAVEAGELSVSDLDARVEEMLLLARRVTAGRKGEPFDAEAHHALARRAAAESAVLLRNEDRILPVAPGARVGLIGDFARAPRYQGAGSSLVNPTRLTNLAEVLAADDIELVGVVPGFRRDGRLDDALVSEAVALARDVDVAVLTLGLPESAESEGMDRSTLQLPTAQVDLLRAVAEVNPRTVVVLSAGGVIETPWLADAAALLHTHLSGQAGAEGIADVLLGRVEPGGRLAETVPLQVTDHPLADAFPSPGRTAEYRERLFVGYRYYDTADIDVQFPFGFGLSYTTFSRSRLTFDGEQARVTVTNTGAREGSDVVQLYVRRVGASSVIRPRWELKGFAKVRLEAGASEIVSLPLGERAFRFFDATVGRWRVEAGEYQIGVGANIRDITLMTTHVIEDDREGAVGRSPAEPAAVASTTTISDADFAALFDRPLPSPHWPDGPLGANDPLGRMRYARSPLARVAYRVLERRRQRAEATGTPDLNILFLLNGPFRIVSKMSGGLATSRLTDALLTLVNGHALRGTGALITAFVRGRFEERRTRATFESLAAGPAPASTAEEDL